ncbi:MAG: hypothetical protein AB9866_16200 [Syntrophobacteraceae bacterium]
MKTAQRLIVIVVSAILLSSCANQLQLLRPVSGSEARLIDIEMPDTVREGLTYDVILTLNYAEERPQVRKVCFRWLAEEISSRSPSLYCYSMGGDLGTGAPCADHSAQGTNTSSPSFCSELSDIRSDVPGKLIVRIRPANLRFQYNRLEAQVEYISDSRVKTTNVVKTPVIAER